MQAFVVTFARCENGRSVVEEPLVFWDRQAAYRHYTERGGAKIPRGHRGKPLRTSVDDNGTICLDLVDLPDRMKYDRAFVLELVGKIRRGEMSQSEASRLYGPSQSRISEWVRDYASDLEDKTT